MTMRGPCSAVTLTCLLAFMATLMPSFPSAESHRLKSKSEYVVDGLGDIVSAYEEFDGVMYAGLIPIHNVSKDATVKDGDNVRKGELMFWLFAPYNPEVEDSLVMWLNGGPGCSSFQCGNLFETGPVTVPLNPAGWCCGKVDEPLKVNEHAWTRKTYMLFLEQPVGVGFSWGPAPESEDDVADDMVGWLHNFFTIFDELKDYDFHMFGESYAGMYVPAIALGIHEDNQKQPEDSPSKINLQGIGLGNGWVDVEIQGSAVIDYAWWHGLIDKRQRDAFMDEWKICLYSSPIHHDTADNTLTHEPYHIFTTPNECGIEAAILKAAGQDIWKGRFEPNTYDVTTWDTYPVIQGSNDSTYQQFYNSYDVKKALNAPTDTHWEGCVPGAGRRRHLAHMGRRRRQLQDVPAAGTVMLDNDRPLSMLPTMATLLDEAKIRVLVYNADLDMSVCAQGSENALAAMQWSGAEDWATQERSIWTTKTQIDKVAGYVQEVQGLTFLVVRNSGHMVPYNQPENALDLLTRFLRNESFADHTVPFYTADPLPDSDQDDTDDVVWRDGNYEEEKESFITWRDVLVYGVLLVAGFGVGFLASSQTRREGYESVKHGN